MSNNPPEISLEITRDEAMLLHKSHTSNIQLSLGMLIQPGLRRETGEKLVHMIETFRSINRKLEAQGVDSRNDS